MSNQPQEGTAQPTDSHRGLRLLGLVAVSAGVLLLMAAAFVLSYTGIHALALSAGVSPRFARIYPGIFDAMLVVACAAVLALRGAGLPSRCYAWLTMLVLLAAAAGADTLHAMNTKLPHKPAAATAAIIPWALVLLGFGLLLSMLRHARLRRAMLAAAPEKTFAQPSGHVEVQQRHGLDDLFGSKNPPDVAAVRYVPPAKTLPVADAAPDLAIESDPGHDDPASDEGLPAANAPGRQEQQPAGYRSNAASAFSPAPTVDLVGDARTPAVPGPGRRTETGPVPEPRRAPGPVADAKPVADAEPAIDPRPTAQAKPVADAEPTAQARPVADAKPTAQAKPAADAKPKPRPAADVKAATETEARADAKPTAEMRPHAKAAPVAEAEPAPVAEAEPALEAEAQSVRGSGPRPDPETASDPETAPEPSAEAEPVPEPEPGSDPETESGAEQVPAVPLQFDRVRSSPVPPEA